jgi:hypothetical protein
MKFLRRSRVAALGATAALAVGALAVGAPAASASVAPSVPTALPGFQGTPIGAPSIPVSFPAGACVTASLEGQGRTGGVANQACTGAGLSFIGPSTAISNVIGPTIITPAFVGSSIVAGGNVAIVP